MAEARPPAALPLGGTSADRQCSITDVDAAAERVDGQTREQLVGASHGGSLPANRDGQFGHVYRRLMVTGHPESVESCCPEPLDRWSEALATPTSRVMRGRGPLRRAAHPGGGARLAAGPPSRSRCGCADPGARRGPVPGAGWEDPVR